MKVFCPNCGSDNEGMAGGRVTCRACTASFEVPRDSSGPVGPMGVEPPRYAPQGQPSPGFSAPPAHPQPVFAPTPTSAPLAGWQPQGAAPPPPAKTNTLAVISLVCGVLCCIPLLSPLAAIILGAIASKQIDQSGGAEKGKGLAIAGIVLGALGLAFNLLSLASAIIKN